MLKNYITSALRNLYKTRVYTIVNILGLSIGMAIFILILSYVTQEKSYDKFHNDYERIYRVRYERYSEDGESVRFASCCPPVGLRIRSLFPEVEKVARIARYPASVSFQDVIFFEERLFYAEPEFFELFNFSFISGDPVNGINGPNKVFISQSTAKKYFGDENPIGKSISIDKKTECEITGVFKDMPQNSHIKLDIVLPWKNLLNLLGPDFDESWGDSGAFTYIKFKEESNITEFHDKLNKLADDEFGSILKQYKLTMTLPLQPLTDIHLNSHFQQEFEVNGDKTTTNLLMVVALLIIVIAWVNYVNLSTARSLTRAKEVGLRKVVGALRFQLMVQLFLEVVIINCIAVVLALLLTLLFNPLMIYLTGSQLSVSLWNTQLLWTSILSLFSIGILLSGLYPVFVLSSFNPLHVLKGKLGSKPEGINLRKALVVFQFTMALGLLSCTLAVFKQVNFMRNQSLGFSIDKVVAVRGPRVMAANHRSNVNSFKQEIVKNSLVDKMCVVTEVPGKQVYWDAGGIAPVGSDESKNYQIVGVDYDFVDLFETKILVGRSFSRNFPSDTVALVLNETAVKWMGFVSPDSCVGKQVNYWGIIYTIIGVMKDYHQQSPKVAFEPHLYRLLPYGRGSRSMFAFKVNSPNAVKVIQSKYEELFPGNPFEYFFLDEYFDRQYKSDIIVGRVFSIFSILAIMVTAMGILGLFSFMVTQRTKEIGIRTVIGADTKALIILFSKDFLWLTLMSFAIAIPLSYYFIIQWLESFTVKMPITISIFLVPLVILAFVAGSTITYQVLRAVRQNPVESLRSE
jgi:putative ABC transport system permease protein